jgi:hypothetical protein
MLLDCRLIDGAVQLEKDLLLLKRCTSIFRISSALQSVAHSLILGINPLYGDAFVNKAQVMSESALHAYMHALVTDAQQRVSAHFQLVS